MKNHGLIVYVECKHYKVSVLQLRYVELLLDQIMVLMISLQPYLTIHLFETGGLLWDVVLEIPILDTLTDTSKLLGVSR